MTQIGTDAEKLNDLTHKVIGCAYTVGNVLGKGFLEKVYENALVHELRKSGLAVEQQRRLVVLYDGVVVGEYVSDLVVEDVLVVEVKAGKPIGPTHDPQCINYLTATRMPIGLVLNFAGKVEIRRLVGPTAPFLRPSDFSDSSSSHPCPSVTSVANSSRTANGQ